jgi:hypothetical protein
MTYYLWALLANVKRCWVADPATVALEGCDLFPGPDQRSAPNDQHEPADPTVDEPGGRTEYTPMPPPPNPPPQRPTSSQEDVRRRAREELERNQTALAKGTWLAAVGGLGPPPERANPNKEAA